MGTQLPLGLTFKASSYLFLDPLPDNAGHLITVELDDGVGNLDLLECGGETSLGHNFRQH